MIKTESALWRMGIGRGLLALAFFLSCSSFSLANPFCLEGDCEDGVGKMPVPTGGYIVGRFYKGKMSGFAFQMLTEARGKEMFCETNMAMGKVSGVQHCYASQLGAHVFMYPKVNGRTDGRTLLVAPNGDVISHKVYESGKEITLELYESDKAAVRDGKSYLLREVIPLLGERRLNRDKRIDAYVKSALWDIPGFKLSGGSLLDSSTPNSRVPIKRAPTSPSATIPSTPKPKKPDPLELLVEKAAELNKKARQYNPLYKLERVYIDRDAYELIYEFHALKSIETLNHRAMEIGAEAAYCNGFKMIPFRKQEMPSRWNYLDSDGNTLSIVTKAEDC